MEKSIITTGKTLDLAIAAALEELNLDRTSVSVEVLENPKSGFFGIGAQPAKVKVTYDTEEEVQVPAKALSSASRSKPKPFVPKSQREPEKKPAPAQTKREEPRREQPKPARAPRQNAPQDTRAPRENRESRPYVEPVIPEVYIPAEPGSTEARIEEFIKGLLERMGSDAVPQASKTGEDSYRVELVGENLGMLIGHRGDTLDAIQHLSNYVINRDATKRSRINVDAENYRLKREQSLQRLAHKVAGKVVKYRRNIMLEPMNAYERHVIHAALQDVQDVSTYSTGTEPNRRIVVAYSKYKSM